MNRHLLLVDPPTGRASALNSGLGWLAANLDLPDTTLSVLPLGSWPCTEAQAAAILRREVAARRPALVGFNIHCTTLATVARLAAGLRAYYDGSIVLGGPHTGYEPERIMDLIPGADLLVVGEGEEPLRAVCERARGDYDGIPGVWYRRTGVVTGTPPAVRRAFGALHHPDYRHFGVTRIHAPYHIATSRGCPYACSFCNPKMGGRGWRPRDLESVFAELQFAQRTFGIREFAVVEPAFNLRPERVIEFCAGLQGHGITLPWHVPSGLRADAVTREMVRAMRAAGCTYVKIGVESLVPEVFDAIDKGETLDDIRRAVACIRAEGMPLWGSFIIGLPHDTPARARRNLALAQELGFTFTEWSLLVPYPGTPAHAWMAAHGTIHHTPETAHQVALDTADGTEVHIACETAEFTRAERLAAFYEINWRSGNYLFERNAPAWRQATTILRGLLRYDPWRLPAHLPGIARRWRQRQVRTGGGVAPYEFAADVLP